MAVQSVSAPWVRGRGKSSLGVGIAGLSALLCVAVAPARAQAQSRLVDRLALRVEGGAAWMLPTFQRSTLAYDAGAQGSARLAFNVIDPLSVQLTASTWWFPSSLGDGQQTLVGGGLRFEPRLFSLGRPFVDVNVGAGFTGPYTRFMLDAGLGFEFDLFRGVSAGPVVRYGRLFTNDSDLPYDAQSISVGLAVTLRIPPAPPPAPVPVEPTPYAIVPAPPPPDTDADGVLDPDDLCRDVPAGAHPDPARAGCPLPDTDGDGVFDPDDQCVSTPQGEHPDPARAGCPDGDDDNDGVLNHADACPAQHHGVHPDPARPGCPLPDRDNDSVPDPTDHCPDQPGAPSTDPNRNGCPGLVRVVAGQLRITQPVFFAPNRDRILPRSNRVLQAVADALRSSPEIHRVSVEGHTDDVGDDARNQDLSQRRADSVMRRLVELGVEQSRLEAHGFGETHPVVPPEGLHGRAQRQARAQNRRVEFRITDPSADMFPAESASPTTSSPAPAPAPARGHHAAPRHGRGGH